MNEKLKLKPEDLEKVVGGDLCGGELDKGDIDLLNAFIIIFKEQGYSKNEFLVRMTNLGASGEALWYIGTHWEEINR